METLEFKSYTEFHQWKEKIERETCSSYVKRRGGVRKPNGDYLLYFNCNRSGKFTPSGKGLRKMKSIQSSKIGTTCASNLRVKITNLGQKVIVKYFKCHDKHSPQLEHLRLPLSVRASIASQLKNGVSVQQIISGIRDASSKSKMNRIFLINEKYLRNIIRDFKVDKKVEKQNLDSNSLKSWIKDMIKKCPVDPMLPSPKGPSCKDDSVSPSTKKPSCHHLTENNDIVNDSSSGLKISTLRESVDTICCPITKAQTFIELYKTCKHNIGEIENKKINEHLNVLIEICSKSNKCSTSYIDSLQFNNSLRPKEDNQNEPVILFKEKNVTINSNTKSIHEKINMNVTKELFELEQVFEESIFYENMVTQDFSDFDDDILDKVLNIHTEFDHSYL